MSDPKVTDLYFDVNGTYMAFGVGGQVVREESVDVPKWVVDVLEDKLKRGVVSAATAISFPYGRKMTVGQALALKRGV